MELKKKMYEAKLISGDVQNTFLSVYLSISINLKLYFKFKQLKNFESIKLFPQRGNEQGFVATGSLR